MHAVAAHPVATVGRRLDHQTGQRLVGLAACHAKQVAPVFRFGIGVDQHVLRHVVHATQIARVLRIAAAPFARGGFEQ